MVPYQRGRKTEGKPAKERRENLRRTGGRRELNTKEKEREIYEKGKNIPDSEKGKTSGGKRQNPEVYKISV